MQELSNHVHSLQSEMLSLFQSLYPAGTLPIERSENEGNGKERKNEQKWRENGEGEDI